MDEKLEVLSEKIGMCSRPSEINSLTIFLVDQKPVWRDVTFPVSHKIPLQFVITMLWVKGLFIDEIVDYGLDFRSDIIIYYIASNTYVLRRFGRKLEFF